MNKSSICFVYPGTVSFAGQTVICELSVEDLRAAGWPVRPVEFPAHDRSAGGLFSLSMLAYFFKLIGAGFRVLLTLLDRHPKVIISHCQTMGGLLRQGLPHLVVSGLRPGARFGTVLHGTLFMKWNVNSFRHRFFLRLIAASEFVTVSSNSQKEKLVEYGVPAKKVIVLSNTTDTQPVTESYIDEKVKRHDGRRTVDVTFLSTLLDVKGFIEYLEGMDQLAQEDRDYDLRVTLCGPVTFSAFCSRFSSAGEKRDWVEGMVRRINAREKVECRWIEGVSSQEKQVVFRETDIFVLPSMHPVESQPLVLLDAMASGCAIVTSRAGSIDETVDEECAILLDTVSTESVAGAVGRLAGNPAYLHKLALGGLARFERQYSRGRHREFWSKAATLLSASSGAIE